WLSKRAPSLGVIGAHFRLPTADEFHSIPLDVPDIGSWCTDQPPQVVGIGPSRLAAWDLAVKEVAGPDIDAFGRERMTALAIADRLERARVITALLDLEGRAPYRAAAELHLFTLLGTRCGTIDVPVQFLDWGNGVEQLDRARQAWLKYLLGEDSSLSLEDPK